MTDAECVVGLRRTWQPSWRIDLRATISALRRGAGDPTLQFVESGVWWATRVDAQPVTACLQVSRAEGAVRMRAWGDGAERLLDELPTILGADDDVTAFVAHHDVVAQAWRRFAGWRVLKTGRVFEALAPAVLEQKVTGDEARTAWRRLVTTFGDKAPGPTPRAMYAPPTPAQWAAIPEWEWYQAGVTPQRRRTLVRAASVGERAARQLRALPGIGPWTEAEVRQRALGDADAVSVGDFHLPTMISWALKGERGRRGDDTRMLELLEPYRGHRYRVQRLLELSGAAAPRRGPRFSPAQRLAVMNPPR